ncbi:MAG TPA: manganese catalase family protein [Desulfitobacterium dehalogenans]|uniref:Manganese catalase family protein n=1 Tax=Desulfitobacterium dehalogenans TaxID=36854 RepID=A0A7C7DBM7_9FIRM|nr:manganese catalase family protein [Desulfitobacterium dehalogenans]
MFKHIKDMEYTVRVDRPDPRFANLLLEQFGGPHGELKAAMQYFSQAVGCNDPKIRDMLQDIAAEELSHFEMVGECIAMLLGPTDKVSRDFPAIHMAILTGGPILTNAMGIPWNASYIETTGDLYADLASNASAELRAKLIYERLLQQTDDAGVKDMVRFLLSREEAHNFSFLQAIETLKGTGVDANFRDTEFTKKYMNLSTGMGDARGPWNQGNGIQYEENPNEKYGGPASYGQDPDADNKEEIGPGYDDSRRNNPQYTQPKTPTPNVVGQEKPMH